MVGALAIMNDHPGQLVRMTVVLIEPRAVTLKQTIVMTDPEDDDRRLESGPVTLRLARGEGVEVTMDGTHLANIYADDIRHGGLMRRWRNRPATVVLRLWDPLTKRAMSTPYARGDAVDLRPTTEGLAFDLRGAGFRV